MSESKHTPGPYIFEPHNGWGGKIGGEVMPFGYISTAHPSPIFELDTPLLYDAEALHATATLLASAPCLLEALKEAQSVLAMMIQPDAIKNSTVLGAYTLATQAEAKARAAISKAEGSDQ